MNLFLDFIRAAVLSGTPLLFGTLGEIVNQKAGHLNMGVEGMMALGACTGFMAAYFLNNLALAWIAAALGGMLGALIYALLTITFMTSQNITGLTLTIFGVGLSNFFGVYMIGKTQAGSLKLPLLVTSQMRDVHIPFLSDLPVVGNLLFSYSPFVYLGIALAIALSYYYRRTKTGLNVRAIGENPAAAEAAGIRVTKYKYLNLLLGGAICGIGGAYCSMMISNGVWINDSVGGLGWISVALVIFAAWSPSRAILGSFVFGIFRVLRFYLPQSAAAIPEALFDMLPFAMTAIVLIASSMRKSRASGQPAACGGTYYREER